MKKPEKKKHIDQVPPMDSSLRAFGYFDGYNQACKDWEKWFKEWCPLDSPPGGYWDAKHAKMQGYQQAKKEFKASLPSKRELEMLMQSFFSDFPTWSDQAYGVLSKILAQAIAKRLKGKK